MYKHWLYDFRRGSLPNKVLLVAFAPLYPVYRFNRQRRARAKSVLGRAAIPLGEISGSLGDVNPARIDPQKEAEVDSMADSFALCRIIGNDLEPRHKAGQSLANVQFILENEAPFEGVTKLWLLNRIFNPETEAKIIDLLDRHGQTYMRLPFDPAVYRSIGYRFDTFREKSIFYDGRVADAAENARALQAILQAYQPKNNYVMNNNGARNAALVFCRQHAKWALPFDGNCFLTPAGWKALRSGVLSARDKRYFVVPMARMQNNSDLLDTEKTFSADEEPQMVFRCDAPLQFNTEHPYGRRPKVELFLHLGIEGPWQRWPHEEFDIPPRKVHADGHRVGQAGWVARLASGKGHLEVAGRDALINRGVARALAIRSTLDMLSGRDIATRLGERRTLCYSELRLAEPTENEFDALTQHAKDALTRGPFSVTHKKCPGPSGDLRDYFHPAPYWWPNPRTKDGLPYVRRDGERLPGTELYDADSDKFDRTRLQRLFDDTTALVLASHRRGADPAIRARACENLRVWFIDPETAMTPHLSYAQVRLGHEDAAPTAHGLIETKDFYFFLDAVRLLDDPDITSGVKAWCERFLKWFLESDHGRLEQAAPNNHGTCYDLQSTALAAFVGRIDVLLEVDLRSQARLLDTITEQGEQPHELGRTLTQHYYAFNLQSWINLFDLLTRAGMSPWTSEAGARLLHALRHMLVRSLEGWAHPQIKPFDPDRLLPLNETLKNRTGEDILGRSAQDGPACFNPHDGIAPYWRLTGFGSVD